MPSLIGRCGGGISRWTGIYSSPAVTAGGGGGGVFLVPSVYVSGDAVLTAGAVNKTGDWALTAVVSPTLGGGIAAGDGFYAQMDVTDTGSGSIGQAAFNSALATAIHPTPPVTLGVTMWLVSGSAFTILVTNGAAGNVDFEISVMTIAHLGGS